MTDIETTKQVKETTDQVNSLAKKSNKSVKGVLKDLLNQTTENGVTNRELLAQKMLSLALNGNEGMIKLVWSVGNEVDSPPSILGDWEPIVLDWEPLDYRTSQK